MNQTGYQASTKRSYDRSLRAFLDWFGRAPHLATREDVRAFLEVLVDGGLGASSVSTHLSALRTVFDRMCGRELTLGLAIPRRPKRVPVVLSEAEVVRVLEAAPSLRDKLLLGLLYAAGLRVSEVVRLRWADIDFARRQLRVRLGKGRRDRMALLPLCLEEPLRGLAGLSRPSGFLFPGERGGRYLSKRTVQRAMARAVSIAGIGKKATPHTLRHSFATHLLEHGTDIRFIQVLLGHARLDTTVIYTKVARRMTRTIESPLDRLHGKSPVIDAPPVVEPPQRVGTMQVHVSVEPDGRSGSARISVATSRGPLALEGITLREERKGWVSLHLPPLESWEPVLRWLSVAQRERIESAGFYRQLQEVVTRRFLRARGQRVGGG